MEVTCCINPKRILFLGLGLNSVFAPALAQPKRDVERIVSIVAPDSPRKALRGEFSPILTAVTGTDFSLKHPDKVINPKLESKSFTGLSLADLLAKTGLSTSEQGNLGKETIAFVGRDGYTVSIPLKDALAAGAIVTALESGKPMDWKKGAPFLAFRYVTAVKYLAEPSWWGWWVSAVIVGQPSTEVTILGKDTDLAELKKLCPDVAPGILNYPRGRRLETPPRRLKGTMSKCSLDQIVGKMAATPDTGQTATPAAGTTQSPEPTPKAAATKGLVVEFLTGQSQMIADPALYRLVFAFEDKPVPVSLGGPIQLCPADGKKECQYFVSSIREAP